MLSRRAALRGGTATVAAIAAGGAVAARVAVDRPDAQLIAWEAEIHEREAAFERQAAGMTEEEADAALNLLADLEHRIAETEAHTGCGLAVKFRRLMKDREDGEGAWTDHNIRTLTTSLNRLAGRAQS